MEKTTTIGFNGLEIDCIIGIYPEERKVFQKLIIDVEVTLDLDLKNDDIKSTIDYEKMADICRDLAKKGKKKLLESLANDILDILFSTFSIKKAYLYIKKPLAIKNASYAFVKVAREKK